MSVSMNIDETSCGPMCQHPACWQSTLRRDKGFPRVGEQAFVRPEIDLDLPTVKVCNMLEDYGDDPKDRFPHKYAGKPNHERSILFPDLQSPIRTHSIKVTRAPQTSPKSSFNNEAQPRMIPVIKFVEVQEVFDPEDLAGTWDETFIPKQYYVWVPNKKKKRRKKKSLASAEGGVTKHKQRSPHGVRFKDVTEDMVPKELEDDRLIAKKKRAQMNRSPVGARHYPVTPRTRGSSKMEFDHEGINELLDLPRDILVQVLESTKQSDLMSKEKIREIIRRFMPPQLERGNTNVSLTSTDLLQQKKLSLHEGNKNVRQPQLMETQPVFHLDDDVVDEGSQEEYESDAYGSLKELYLGGGNTARSFGKYKNPLPSIAGGQSITGETNKMASISLGLPELPSGIRHTRPFTYSKKMDFDFTLGPVPTPPTSFCSSETMGSRRDTPERANAMSNISAQSEYGSATEEATTTPREVQRTQSRESSLRTISPSIFARVPQAPVSTPATYQSSTAKSPKSAGATMVRDTPGSTITASPQDWALQEKYGSPAPMLIGLRAPMNTPGSVPDAGLGTIKEAGQEYGDLPQSRGGLSVRFEIPEVPPPPSSPQESDKESVDYTIPSANTATINSTKETPSTSNKPTSGTTVRTNEVTVGTSLHAENSVMKSLKSPTGTQIRELSMVSSPEPWPQVNEADYDVTPALTADGTFHTAQLESDIASKDRKNKSKNAADDGRRSEGSSHRASPEIELQSDFVNKATEPASVVKNVKKMMEKSRETASPAPPPPSPEGKEDEMSVRLGRKSKSMTPVIEEGELRSPVVGVSMTVTQISPKGVSKRSMIKSQRQVETFVNIDIPAAGSQRSEPSPGKSESRETVVPTGEVISEELEPSPEEIKTRDVALSVQSTLAGRTITDRSYSEASNSLIEPAMSQASHGPALSEDSAAVKPGKSEVFNDWTGVVIGSDGVDTQAMLSSEKPDLDMTEEGGDHDGFKEDLKREYDRLEKETNNEEGH